MKSTILQRPIHLTMAFQSHAVGAKVTFTMAFFITLATSIFLLMMGPIGNPDFWQPVPLVNLGSNLLMFFAAIFIALAPLGFSWHFFLSSIDAALSLPHPSYNTLRLPSLWQLFVRLRRAVARLYLSFQGQLRRIQNLLRILQALHQRRSPQQRSKSKTPLLLFMQAPLLLAP